MSKDKPIFVEDRGSKSMMVVDPDHYRDLVDKYAALSEKYAALADKYADLLIRNIPQ